MMLNWLPLFFKNIQETPEQLREKIEEHMLRVGWSSITPGVRVLKIEQNNILVRRVVDAILPQNVTSVSEEQRQQVERILTRLSSNAREFNAADSDDLKNTLLDQFNTYWSDYFLNHASQNAAPAQN